MTITLANVVTGLVVARLLGPTGRGQLAAILNWQTIGGALAALGLPDAIVYFTAKRPVAGFQYFSTALLPTLVVGACLAAVGWYVMPILLPSQSGATVSVARLYVLSIPLEAAWSLPDRVLRGRSDFSGWNRVRIVPPVMWLGCLLIAALSGRGSPRVLVELYLLSRLVSFPLLVGWIYLRAEARPGLLLSEARPMLRYGLPNLANILPSAFNNRADQLIMAALLPARELGLYAVAVAWSTFTNPVSMALSNILFPRLAGTTSRVAQRQALEAGARGGLIASLVPSLAFLPLTPLAIPLVLGSAFSGAVPVALLVVVASIFSGWNLVLEEAARGLGRPWLPFFSEAFGLLLTIGILVPLLPRWGLIAAGLASIAGYAATSGMMLWLLKQREVMSLRAMAVPRASDFRAFVGRRGSHLARSD